MSDLTPEQLAALDIARKLAAAGVPIFLAHPRETKLGFVLPDAWEQTVADPAVLDAWRPGMAVCALMGHGLDLLDIDPRNGGDIEALNGATPTSYAIAATPSGGMHSYIASLWVGSRDNIYPGIDVKGGYPPGTEGTSGRGFGFIAPTEGVSKVTGARVAYRWLIAPDLAKLATGDDDSGAGLAEHIRALKADSGSVAAAIGGPDWWREFANQREPHSEPAAQRAISEKLTEVVGWKREAGIGFRQTLLRAAMTLGGYVGGGYLPDDVAQAALTEACTAVWGSADGEDLKWIAQGLADGATRPFPVYSAADEILAAAGEEPTAWTIYSVIGTEPFDPSGTDQELAQDVSMRIKPALRYAGGSWVVRDQVVWYEAPDMADWAVSTLARVMPLGNLDADKDTEPYRQAARRAKFMGAGSAGVEKKLRAIARHPRDPLAVRLEELDTDHEILWAGGLPWNIRGSAEEPAIAEWISWDTPHMRSAFCTPARIPTPHWDAFLAAVWPDPLVRAWALRVLSIAFTGYADEAMPVLWGTERTGKSQTVSLLVKVLGGYAHAADPRLLAGVDNVHASVVYALKGRRLSFIDEGPRAGHLALERLKQLTGGTELTGNAMRANPVTFAPTHTLIMTTNNEPSITDPALRARMRIIPCNGDITAVRAARRALGPVWMTEAPGVLAQMMAQAARWLAEPDTARNEAAPEGIRAAVTDMVRGQDPVADWVDLCTVPATPGDQASVLYRHFCEWFDASAVHRRTSRPTSTAFGRRLTDIGYPAVELHLTGTPGTVRYRPLTVLGGTTGPWVPPPTVAVDNSAEKETSGGIAPQTRNGAGSESASAEQTRSTKPDGGENANCATANGANGSETDKTAKSGTVEPSAVGAVGGQSGGSCGAELPPSEKPRSDSTTKIFRDSGDSHTSLPEDQKNKKINIHPFVENSELPGENGKKLPTTPNDHGNVGTSAPSTSADPAGVVADSNCPPVSASAASASVEQKSINSDLVPDPASDITARLLASANAAKTTDPKISRIDQHRGENSNTSPDLGKLSKTDKSSTAKRTKLTPEQKEANRLARLAANAAERETARLAKIIELAGPILDLPATVLRGNPPRSVTVAEAVEAARRATERNGGTLVVDIETSGYPIGHRLHRVQSVQLGDLIEACDFDPHDAEQAEAIKLLIAEAPALGAFSATADLAPLAHMGLIDHESAWQRMEDLIHRAKLADPAGARSDAGEGLKALAASHLGPDSVSREADEARGALFTAAGWLTRPTVDTPPERNGWTQVDPRCATMISYACADVLDTAALAYRLPHPGEALINRERAFQRLTARISYHGAPIDRDHAENLLSEHVAAQNAAASVIRAHGIDKPGSTVQVGAALLARGARLPQTPTGKPSVAEGALQPMTDAAGDLGVLVRALLEYNKHDTAIGTFLRPYVNLCRYGDGRARPTVYTMEAATGRTSCVRPNFQNIPREGGFRKIITSDSGYLMIGADFSGVELRVAAALSQDQHLLSIILADDAAKRRDPKAKSDIHWKIAIAAYGPDATKSQRYNVKRGVFGRLYGSGVPGIAKTLGITMTEAQMIVEILDDMTPGLAAWSAGLRNQVKSGLTHFPSHSGRIIHLDPREPHKAGNYCIQGEAREIIVDALLDWAQTPWGTSVGIPVHDEWDAWVPEAEADAATEALVACMTREFRGVPILAEASEPCRYWADSA